MLKSCPPNRLARLLLDRYVFAGQKYDHNYVQKLFQFRKCSFYFCDATNEVLVQIFCQSQSGEDKRLEEDYSQEAPFQASRRKPIPKKSYPPESQRYN